MYLKKNDLYSHCRNRRPRSQSPSPKVQISPARTISGDLKSCEGDSIASGDTELPRAQISFNLEGAVLPKGQWIGAE